MNKYTYHVSGTHCTSCKILIEDILNEQEYIKNINVNLKLETVEIETNENIEINELLLLLNDKVKGNNYVFSIQKIIKDKKDDTIWQAIPIGLIFLVLFFVLQKSGILNFSIGGKTTPTTSFIIGLIASISSCLAIVGGLVLSLSAKISEDDISDTKTFVLFHIGRIISFAFLGGLLGLIGKSISISFTFSSILGIITSLVMFLLGLNLIGLLRKNKFTLSSNFFQKLSSFFKRIEHKTLTPLMIGFSTFFLPCGFTQTMQIAAIASGSFISGFLIMLAFAIGTLPMLAILSFGSASFAHGKYAPLFFKTVGIIVIGLGIFALLSGLAGLGIINPIFNI